MRALTAAALAAAVLVTATACGKRGVEEDLAALSSNSDKVIFEAGEEAVKSREWEPARQHFRRIIEGLSSSPLVPAARIAVADSYFEEGGTASYILAVAAYRDFLTLFPSHPRSDYAQYQVAESYFRQMNGPDRDQTPTRHALEEYQRLLTLYPKSSYADIAGSRVKECRLTLARSEFAVGYFYAKTREAYRAAVLRYEGLLKDYPEYDRVDEVLFRMAEALVKEDRATEAAPHLARLLKDYPTSEYVAPAQELLATIASVPAPPPPPSPAPAGSPSPTPSLK